MLKKLSIVLSVAAALGLGLVLTAPTPVDAQGMDQPGNQARKGGQGSKVQGNTNQGNRIQGNRIQGNRIQGNRIQGNRIQGHRTQRNRNFVVGRNYGGHIWYGQTRHRWHDTWYDYGVGPCWINVGGLWFWNVLLCP